jgi:hypothetical protein
VNTRLLNEVAPLSIRLRNGRQTKVHYERGRPPWISSRLQDFFGMKETPRIGPDKTPLVIHLCRPFIADAAPRHLQHSRDMLTVVEAQLHIRTQRYGVWVLLSSSARFSTLRIRNRDFRRRSLGGE